MTELSINPIAANKPSIFFLKGGPPHNLVALPKFSQYQINTSILCVPVVSCCYACMRNPFWKNDFDYWECIELILINMMDYTCGMGFIVIFHSFDMSSEQPWCTVLASWVIPLEKTVP